MKSIKFNEIKEEVFFERLPNGLDVYMYPTKKSKNFYATFNVRYGSSVTSYKKDGKLKYVIPGTAHFLEHKLMNFTTNKEFFRRINKLGSVANAYTTYDVTNYNIFGSTNIIENISLIFDMVLKPDITTENVKSEIGIISEEIDMDKDDINTYLYIAKNRNLFHKSFPINHILGEKEDIKSITSKYLKDIYNDFYRPDNMFIIVVGNFNKDEVIEYIREYMKSFKNKDSKIQINRVKEPDHVKCEYEVIKKEVSEDKVYYSIKVNKNVFGKISISSLNYYLRILLSSNFSVTSPLYEKYKVKNLITSMQTNFKIYNSHLIITIKVNTPNSKEFIKNIKKDIKKINIDKSTFERKRKVMLSELILSFENIEDAEYLITNNVLMNKKLSTKDYQIIKSLNYNDMLKVMKSINLDNVSILLCTK